MAKPPQEALTRIEIDHLQTLKTRWDEAYAAGMTALKRGDHRAAGEALRLQRDIIEQQRTLLLFRLSRVRSERLAEQPGPADGSAVSMDASPDQKPPVEQIAWTLKKNGNVVQALLRTEPTGTELRCIYEGAMLWTEWFPSAHDPAMLTLAIEGTLTAWLTKGFIRA